MQCAVLGRVAGAANFLHFRLRANFGSGSYFIVKHITFTGSYDNLNFDCTFLRCPTMLQRNIKFFTVYSVFQTTNRMEVSFYTCTFLSNNLAR